MKKNRIAFLIFMIWPLLLCLSSSCGQQNRDEGIKADLTIKAKEDVNFAGISYTVENGTVILTGSCPTAASIELVRRKVRSIHVIDSLVDHLIIAPVILDRSFALKLKVDSVLAKYPKVIADVSDSTVVLKGRIPIEERNKLLISVELLHPHVESNRLISGN